MMTEEPILSMADRLFDAPGSQGAAAGEVIAIIARYNGARVLGDGASAHKISLCEHEHMSIVQARRQHAGCTRHDSTGRVLGTAFVTRRALVN